MPRLSDVAGRRQMAPSPANWKCVPYRYVSDHRGSCVFRLSASKALWAWLACVRLSGYSL